MDDSERKIYLTDSAFDFGRKFFLSEDVVRVSPEELKGLRERLTLALTGDYELITLNQLIPIIGPIEEKNPDAAFDHLNSILEKAQDGEVIISFDPYENELGQPIEFFKRTIERRWTIGEVIIREAERAKRNAILDEGAKEILVKIAAINVPFLLNSYSCHLRVFLCDVAPMK